MSIWSIIFSDIILFLLFILSTKKYILKPNMSKMWWTFGFFEGFISVLGYLLSVYTHIYFFFYIYYFFGAGLTPAILGLGSIYLLPKSKFNFQLYTTYVTTILSIILVILLVFFSYYSQEF